VQTSYRSTPASPIEDPRCLKKLSMRSDSRHD
jgi:hypothetical protein